MTIDLSALDLSGLSHETVSYPDTVKSRVVQIDADFLAYQVSYEKEDDPKSPEDMKHNASVAVEHIRQMAAAEHAVMHLTPFTSDKGGRYKQAIQKPYQGNRVDKPKPRMLHVMRQWLSDNYRGVMCETCEADDSMAAAQYQALAAGNRDLSIIASKDKDLDMVPGLHMVWDTGDIIDTAASNNGDFGWVDLKETRSASGSKSSKLKGYGHKWFWAQMLIGDTADHIAGLPKVTGAVLNQIDPTAAVRQALQVVAANVSADGKPSEKALATARKVLADRKPKACGPAMAIKFLDMITNNHQAFHAVKGLYENYGHHVGFKDYNGNEVPWQSVFVSEAQLLWMRRNISDPNDVIHWFKEIA